HLRDRIRGRAASRALYRKPACERCAVVGKDHEAHVRMLRAAEFLAYTLVDAWHARAKAQLVRIARNGIDLSLKTRYPEAVNHVRRREDDPHRLARGDMNLVRGLESIRARGRFILDFPPPLMPDDAQCQSRRWIGGRARHLRHDED